MQREISIKSDQNVGAAGNEQPPNQRIKRFSRYPQSSLACKFDALTVVRLCREKGANKKEKKEGKKREERINSIEWLVNSYKNEYNVPKVTFKTNLRVNNNCITEVYIEKFVREWLSIFCESDKEEEYRGDNVEFYPIVFFHTNYDVSQIRLLIRIVINIFIERRINVYAYKRVYNNYIYIYIYDCEMVELEHSC